MTVEEKKIKTWYCEKCPTFKGDNSDPIDDDSTLFKNVKLVHQNHKGWQIGTPKESYKDGVKVNFDKPVDMEQFKEPLRPDDSEILTLLKGHWNTIKSNADFETKKESRIKINELEVKLGNEKTVWLPDEMQKEVDECWKTRKSLKGSGVTKKQKENAETRINELEN